MICRVWIDEVSYEDPFLTWLLYATGVLRVVQGRFGHHPVYLKHHLGRQRRLRVAADMHHRLVVVDDHSLGVGPGRSVRAEQVLGISASGRGALEQAGGYCFLHQASDYVSGPVTRVDHVLG